MDQDEFVTYHKVITGPDFMKWLDTMISEMDFMYINWVWTLVVLPISYRVKMHLQKKRPA